MTLTVFIIENGKRSSSYLEMLRRRFQFVKDTDFVYCQSVQEVNERSKHTVWYLILHEGEITDARLTLAIFKVVKICRITVATTFNLFKRTNGGRFFIAPRLFSANTELRNDCVMPKAELTTVATNLLDGWICDV